MRRTTLHSAMHRRARPLSMDEGRARASTSVERGVINPARRRDSSLGATARCPILLPRILPLKSSLDVCRQDDISLCRRRRVAFPQSSPALSRNEKCAGGMSVAKHDVIGALGEKPHYKTQLDDRIGVSIIADRESRCWGRLRRPARPDFERSRCQPSTISAVNPAAQHAEDFS